MFSRRKFSATLCVRACKNDCTVDRDLQRSVVTAEAKLRSWVQAQMTRVASAEDAALRLERSVGCNRINA